MALPNGILIHFNEPARKGHLQDAILRGSATFMEALSIPDWKPKAKHLALICFSDETIDYLAIMTRGDRVVTGKFRVEFDHFVALGEVLVAEIKRKLAGNIRRYFVQSASGVGGMVPPTTFAESLLAIKDLRPGMAQEIDDLVRLVSTTGSRIGGRLGEHLLEQKDATNTEFTNGVNRGWLGTVGATSAAIQTLIQKFLQGGNAVMIALEDVRK